MNWNDELCGKIVTPERWAGGVIALAGEFHPGAWCNLMQLSSSAPDRFRADLPFARETSFAGQYGYEVVPLCEPIFPPRGWAGKTDAELFASRADEDGRIWFSSISYSFWMEVDGLIRFSPHSPIAETLHDSAGFILALQNAQVLARRLQPESSVHNQTV